MGGNDALDVDVAGAVHIQCLQQATGISLVTPNVRHECAELIDAQALVAALVELGISEKCEVRD
jgi:hypothetical protein